MTYIDRFYKQLKNTQSVTKTTKLISGDISFNLDGIKRFYLKLKPYNGKDNVSLYLNKNLLFKKTVNVEKFTVRDLLYKIKVEHVYDIYLITGWKII